MRRVFIGDVQGCADELDLLLARVDDELGRETEVWLVGDLVNRGPDDLRVLERVRARVEDGRARVVLGNHEIHLLHLAWGSREPGPSDTVQHLLARQDAGEWVEWIRRLPLVATGKLGHRRFAMLHAASAPGWTLSELKARGAAVEQALGSPDLALARRFLASQTGRAQDDLERVVSCRSVNGDGWSSKPPDELPGAFRAWHAAWAEREHAHALIYGHWARQRLHVAASLRGLDTGCVHHGRGAAGYLTAWLPDPSRDDPFELPDAGFWHLEALQPYYRGA